MLCVSLLGPGVLLFWLAISNSCPINFTCKHHIQTEHSSCSRYYSKLLKSFMSLGASDVIQFKFPEV